MERTYWMLIEHATIRLHTRKSSINSLPSLRLSIAAPPRPCCRFVSAGWQTVECRAAVRQEFQQHFLQKQQQKVVDVSRPRKQNFFDISTNKSLLSQKLDHQRRCNDNASVSPVTFDKCEALSDSFIASSGLMIQLTIHKRFTNFCASSPPQKVNNKFRKIHRNWLKLTVIDTIVLGVGCSFLNDLVFRCHDWNVSAQKCSWVRQATCSDESSQKTHGGRRNHR